MKPDPRQTLFLVNYLDPKSETFSNALQSALKAGYTQEYAENITHKMPDWLTEKVGDGYLIKKAEENLKEFLEEKKDKRLKADLTKFVLERLNKNKYSSRNEHTGKDGERLHPKPILAGESNDIPENNSNPEVTGA